MAISTLKVEGLHFSYAGRHILAGVSFEVKAGEIVTLLGRSGCGKTTLLRVLAGLLLPTEGKITLCQEEHLSYMIQEDLLLPWRTVLQNVLLPAELNGFSPSKETITQRAKELLTRVGLSAYIDKFPNELSGGMRQRVSLVRSLLLGSSILLLDEPFASLDVCTREDLYGLVKEVSQKEGISVLLVTHDFRDALALSDRVLLINHGVISRRWNLMDEPQGGSFCEEFRSELKKCTPLEALNSRGAHTHKEITF